MQRIIVGGQDALMSQLNWQILHGWTRLKSLERWHKNHPDISDDIFEQLYNACVEAALACAMYNSAGNIKTVDECYAWAKQELLSRSQTQIPGK